jgi:hypothetical protein
MSGRESRARERHIQREGAERAREREREREGGGEKKWHGHKVCKAGQTCALRAREGQ